MRVKCLGTAQCPLPGLEPGPLAPESGERITSVPAPKYREGGWWSQVSERTNHEATAPPVRQHSAMKWTCPSLFAFSMFLPQDLWSRKQIMSRVKIILDFRVICGTTCRGEIENTILFPPPLYQRMYSNSAGSGKKLMKPERRSMRPACLSWYPLLLVQTTLCRRFNWVHLDHLQLCYCCGFYCVLCYCFVNRLRLFWSWRQVVRIQWQLSGPIRQNRI